MIEQIKVAGYKCLQLAEPLKAKALNVLVGSNASGKSTLLQTLLLLRQSADESRVIRDLHLSGALYEAGTANDVLHPSAEHRIVIELGEGGRVTEFSFVFKRAEAGVQKRQLPAHHAAELPGALGGKSNVFSYLNAERVGPRVSYPLPPDDGDLAGLVGKHGEFTAGRLARSADGIFIAGWGKDLIKVFAEAQEQLDSRSIEGELTESGGRLDLVSNLMLAWIIPGAVFSASEEESVDSAPLRFVRDPNSTRVMTRATHVGFGLAYALPILVGGLGLAPGGMLIVENPEAHLHPFSQSRMGVFLALLAASGRQVFVETHSDHVVNGIRLALRFKFVDPAAVVFNYFRNKPDEARSEVTQINPDSEGTLESWPAGFFDQIERDLARL